MTAIEELQKTKTDYVTENGEKIINEIVTRNAVDWQISTCDSLSYGWDRTLHFAMPQIAQYLRNKGFKVTSSVKWGVTDWLITL